MYETPDIKLAFFFATDQRIKKDFFLPRIALIITNYFLKNSAQTFVEICAIRGKLL